MKMNEDIMLSRLYRELADTLNISETMTNEIVKSYKAVEAIWVTWNRNLI